MVHRQLVFNKQRGLRELCFSQQCRVYRVTAAFIGQLQAGRPSKLCT
jgi:hypothetical protein